MHDDTNTLTLCNTESKVLFLSDLEEETDEVKASNVI